MPSARSLPCARCGGRFAIATIAGEVHCPYCGEPRVISVETIRELEAYSEEVDHKLGKADEELGYVDAWQRTEESVSWSGIGVPIAIVVGVPGLAAVMMYLLSTGGRREPQFYARMSIGMTTAVPLLLLGWSLWRFFAHRSKRGASSVGPTKVACPGCGAPAQMQGGERLHNCTHCGCALIPSEALIEAVVSDAEAQRRAAQLQRFAAERTGMLKLMNYSSKSRILPFVMMSPYPIFMVGGLVWASLQMAREQMSYNPLIFVGWGVLAVSAGIFALWLHLRGRRREALDRALEALATQLQGRREAGLDHAVAWLNTHWPAAYETHHIHAGPEYGCVTGHVHGYPVMVDLSLVRTDQYRKPRLHLFVAAAPGHGATDDDRRRANLLEKSVEREGFDLRRSEAGAVAMASQALVKQIRDTPTSILALVPELNRMTHLLAALRRAP